MKNLLLSLVVLILAFAAFPTTALGQEGEDAAAAAAEEATPGMVIIPDDGLKAVGIGVGLGIVIIGGARGIGNIGRAAVESMARQPEAAKDISGAMVLSAAFVEGATLFGVVTLLLAVFAV